MKSLIAVISMVVATNIFAADSTNLAATVCGDVKGMEAWTLESSGNVTNGVKDQQAYVRVTFSPSLHNGRWTQTWQSFKVENLVWDKKFKTVVYTGKNGVTVCGKKSLWSGVKLAKECAVTFKQEIVVQDNTDCQGTASSMVGTFTVQ